MKELFEDRFGNIYELKYGYLFDIGKRDPLSNNIIDTNGSLIGSINQPTNHVTLGSSNNGYFVPNSAFDNTILKKDFK